MKKIRVEIRRGAVKQKGRKKRGDDGNQRETDRNGEREGL